MGKKETKAGEVRPGEVRTWQPRAHDKRRHTWFLFSRANGRANEGAAKEEREQSQSARSTSNAVIQAGSGRHETPRSTGRARQEPRRQKPRAGLEAQGAAALLHWVYVPAGHSRGPRRASCTCQRP